MLNPMEVAFCKQDIQLIRRRMFYRTYSDTQWAISCLNKAATNSFF